MSFEVEVKLEENITDKLSELQKNLGDLTPVFNQIGHTLIDIVEENFESENFLGKPWTPLKDSTKKQKAKKGYKKTLQNRGHLAESIDFEASKNKLVLGTNVEYAAIHQFGGLAGKNHSAKIPAREFLPIVKEGDDYIYPKAVEEEIDIILENFLRKLDE